MSLLRTLSPWAALVAVCGVLLAGAGRAPTFADDAPPTFPGTAPWTGEQPLDEVMLAGLQRYCRRELAAAPERRTQQWPPAVESPEVRSARQERLRTLIGAVDPRITAGDTTTHRWEMLTPLGGTSVAGRSGQVTAHVVRWPVLDGVTAEGVLLVPHEARAAVVAVPDAAWTPETLAGLDGELPGITPCVRWLAENGCLVVIPQLISRRDDFSGHPRVRYTNQPHREFLYRQAFEVGRHIVGYEVQKVLAAVDLSEQELLRRAPQGERPPRSIGVVGVGEGGPLALYAAALDARLQACWVSGYFEPREELWREPIYRNVWRILTEFGDAELAGLMAPRRLIVEACRAVEVPGPPAPRPGRSPTAAPGRIATCALPSVRTEWERAARWYSAWDRSDQIVLAVSGDQGDGPAGTPAALRAFATGLGLDTKQEFTIAPWSLPPAEQVQRHLALHDPLAREQRQFHELQGHVQQLLRQSHQVRSARWRSLATTPSEWERARQPLRDWVQTELIGRLSGNVLPPRPRSRLLSDQSAYATYEIVLDVYPDLVAVGILLWPKNLQAGERRPVVVCQHGLEGTPRDTFSREGAAFASYQAFAEELVKRGWIVYAPQNPYRGGDRFRELQRLSQPLGRTLFSYIVAQHEQTLAWLATVPQVDPTRMAFYGLSYGGKTAMRVPPLVERYALSICSGDFTDWPRTIAANDETFSYLFTSEYEIPEWNLAHVASYAELAQLMSPRPFMVEAGHRDGGQPTEWVAGEFGKVRRHYDQLKIGDRAEIEFFDGPHQIHGRGTFRFLERHLAWPVPSAPPR